MSSLVILGSSGFLGRNFLNNTHPSLPIKAVARNIPSDIDQTQKEVTWLQADLMSSASLSGVLALGDIVINLAYISDAGEEENVNLIDSVIEACQSAGAARLIHCSTAVVVGNSKDGLIDESSPCVPVTLYEKTKWAVEQRVLNAMSSELDVGILRPTAVVGPGGKNLLKMVNSLQNGNNFANYLKACILGKRPMHLVSVRNVIDALVHMSEMSALKGNSYIISSDEDPDNNYMRAEAILMEALGLGTRKIPPVVLPKKLLSIFFKCIGRGDMNLKRIYDSRKLLDEDFKPVDSVAVAIKKFAESFILNNSINTSQHNKSNNAS